MPKRTDDYMSGRKQHIIDALARCVRRQGWNQTTIEDVAKESGLSIGAIYLHFANKRALLLGLLAASMSHTDSHARLNTLTELKADILESTQALTFPSAQQEVAGHFEAVIDGIRDEEIRGMIDIAARHLAHVLEDVVRKLCSGIADKKARTEAMTLLLIMEGIRSFRVSTNLLNNDDIKDIFDLQFERIQSTQGKTNA